MEHPAPAITVVIPVFNGENYLGEAVESVLAQTFRDFEILIVDDGSTDTTWTIVERYMATYPGVVRGLRKQNGGPATALNAGIQAAQGKYFAWLSHDDRFVPHKLATQFTFLSQHPEIVGVYNDYALIDDKGVTTGMVYSVYYRPRQMMRHLLQAVFINGSTLMIERRCLQEVGLFDESIRYANDAIMWLHLTHRYQLGYIPEPLTEYRMHPNQTTHRATGIRRDGRLWLKRAIETFTLEDFFPELKRPHLPAQDRAAAYTYLGDVMARHFYLALCLQLYWKAWRAWPSLHNPAPVKAVRQARQLVTVRLTQLMQLRHSPTVPFDESNQKLLHDFRFISESVKNVRFTFDTE